MLFRFVASLFLISFPLLVVAADWNQIGDSGVPVNLEADQLSFDKASGRYQASGNVQLNQGELEVRSDLLWWNQISGEIVAEGDVQLNSPEERMSGRKVEYNLQQGTGRH